jgi:hypothetical protein
MLCVQWTAGISLILALGTYAAGNQTPPLFSPPPLFLCCRIQALQSSTWKAKPDHIHLDVGTLYRHKKWGYRGVVVGWFPSCPADAEWVKRYGPFEQGLDQAFYRYHSAFYLAICMFALLGALFWLLHKSTPKGATYQVATTKEDNGLTCFLLWTLLCRTLVDTRDRPPFMTIAAEENLEALHEEKVSFWELGAGWW